MTKLDSKYDTYTSYYIYDTQVLREKQYISEWYEWERETRVGHESTYTVNTELIDYYVPASVAAFYIFVAVLALILLLFVKCCCRRSRNRVQYYGKGGVEIPADMPTAVEKDDFGMGKDIAEFELAKKKGKKKFASNSDLVLESSMHRSYSVANDETVSKGQKDIFAENQRRIENLERMLELQRLDRDKHVAFEDDVIEVQSSSTKKSRQR